MSIQEKSVIEIDDLRFCWSKHASQDGAGLAITQWRVDSGEKLFIEGQSGSGKSTLLNIISGILVPQKGAVNVLGQDLTALSAVQRDRFRAANIGVIFQQFNLLPYLTVKQNIQLSQLFINDSSREYYDISALIDCLNLPATLLNQKAAELSIGQQQRVAVARALYHRPPLIIADEPTSALDMRNRDEFIQLLLKYCEECGSTVLFVSHDYSLAKHFDRTITMEQLNTQAASHVS